VGSVQPLQFVVAMPLRASLGANLLLAVFGLVGCAGGISGEPIWTAGGDGGDDASDLPPYLGDDGASPGPTSYEAGASSSSSGGFYVDSGGGYPSSSGGGSSSGGSSSGGKYNCGTPVCSFDQNSPPDCGCTWTDSNGSLHLWGCVPNVACGCYNVAHTFAPSAGPYSAGECSDTASASKAALQACCN
jgi:hypothetical protein